MEKKKAKLGLILYNVNFWLENPVFVLCKERRVVIKLFFKINTFWQVFKVQMAFIGIRLFFVGFTMCRTKRKKNSARDQLGWATTHFQSWVATL